jgi:hypothetical protein
MEDKSRKAYVPPTITNFGNVVEQTKGFGGDSYESYMPKPWVYDDFGKKP